MADHAAAPAAPPPGAPPRGEARRTGGSAENSPNSPPPRALGRASIPAPRRWRAPGGPRASRRPRGGRAGGRNGGGGARPGRGGAVTRRPGAAAPRRSVCVCGGGAQLSAGPLIIFYFFSVHSPRRGVLVHMSQCLPAVLPPAGFRGLAGSCACACREVFAGCLAFSRVPWAGGVCGCVGEGCSCRPARLHSPPGGSARRGVLSVNPLVLTGCFASSRPPVGFRGLAAWCTCEIWSVPPGFLAFGRVPWPSRRGYLCRLVSTCGLFCSRRVP